MKVAVYCRVSRDDQDASKQESLCKDCCARLGYAIYAIYKDEGVSGMKESRPAFDVMLADMRLYKFDCIMVTKLDRIGRSLQHILSLFDEFKRKKVFFIAVTQDINTTTSVGTLLFQLLGAFAEFERNIISERTIEGLKHKKSNNVRGPDKKQRRRRGKNAN